MSINSNNIESNGSSKENLGKAEETERKTVDEKIDAMAEWLKKYPKAKLSYSVDQDVLKDYSKTDDEYKQIQQEYERMREYYNYIDDDDDIFCELSKEQLLKCKNMNLGGIFGYTNHIEELAKKFRVDEEEIDYILTNYGSIYGFYQAYKNKQIDEGKQHDFELIDLVANNVINVDLYNIGSTETDPILGLSKVEKKGTEGYDFLYKYKVVNSGNLYPNGDVETVFYSGLDMLASLDTLFESSNYEQPISIMEKKYGIYHGLYGEGPRTLNSLAKEYKVSKAEIERRLKEAYKCLGDPRLKEGCEYDLAKIINSEYVTDEEKAQLDKLQADIEDNFLHLDDTSYSAMQKDPKILDGFRILYSVGNRVREKEEEKKKLAVKQNKGQNQENLGEVKEDKPQDIIENVENGDIETMSQEENTDNIVDMAEDKINLGDMTPEQLQSIINANDETIMHNENEIKKALIARILEQQEIISKQKAEMKRLKEEKNKGL